MRENIIVYHSRESCGRGHCHCAFCYDRKGMAGALRKLGYNVKERLFVCDWDFFYPANIHFDYAIEFHGTIFGSLMFECDKFPYPLKIFTNTFFDYIICASEFLRQAWINSGVDENRLVRTSVGIDTSLFNPNKSAEVLKEYHFDEFKFLSVGSWQPEGWEDRKGFERLIQIFQDQFGDSKEAILIIKTKGFGWKSYPDNIKIISSELSTRELASLYKHVSQNGAYVHLHRGEGYCRPLIEALLCKCKIGTTGWSGPLDFLNKDNSTLFSYKLLPSKVYPEEFYEDSTYPKWADVNIDEVGRWMRKVCKEKGRNKADTDIKNYSWKVIAEKFMAEVRKRI